MFQPVELSDPDFTREFLYSYRIIIGPIKLLTMLIDRYPRLDAFVIFFRYDFMPPNNCTKENLEYHTKYAPTVKLR